MAVAEVALEVDMEADTVVVSEVATAVDLEVDTAAVVVLEVATEVAILEGDTILVATIIIAAPAVMAIVYRPILVAGKYQIALNRLC